MTRKQDWEKLVHRMERLMRLKTHPVAFKLHEDKEPFSGTPFLRRVHHKTTLCQLINLVRNSGWTVGAEPDDFISEMCPSIVGMAEIPEIVKDGTFRSIVWTKNRADGRKYENAIPRIPFGRYKALTMAPLVHNPFEPDIVLIYANPAQMMLLINALQFEDYEVMQFHCVGETSCADAIARCYLDGKPSLTIPCYGERRYGHAQDDELVMAVPAAKMEKALHGMENLYKRGIRYPISYAGAGTDLTGDFPAAYSDLREVEKLRGNDNRLLLGVTGGIASGKSTVARMLEELGARTIDFDVLSRIVVEPGKPAYNEIVDYFGKEVLLEDRTLDRKKLSEIVFRDSVKRKKLESFIHPKLGAEFIRFVEQYAAEAPGVVIQAVIPLLIEGNMQATFHKILLVYIPKDEQVKRLMKRDNISKKMAEKMLDSQMSIEEKRGYADFVIDNSGPVEETRRQVEELMRKLKAVP